MNPKILLISNSKPYDGEYLDHCEGAFRKLLPRGVTVLFVPYAQFDCERYTLTTEAHLRQGLSCPSTGKRERR